MDRVRPFTSILSVRLMVQTLKMSPQLFDLTIRLCCNIEYAELKNMYIMERCTSFPAPWINSDVKWTTYIKSKKAKQNKFYCLKKVHGELLREKNKPSLFSFLSPSWSPGPSPNRSHTLWTPACKNQRCDTFAFPIPWRRLDSNGDFLDESEVKSCCSFPSLIRRQVEDDSNRPVSEPVNPTYDYPRSYLRLIQVGLQLTSVCCLSGPLIFALFCLI